jgi:hypothetical protein
VDVTLGGAAVGDGEGLGWGRVGKGVTGVTVAAEGLQADAARASETIATKRSDLR